MRCAYIPGFWSDGISYKRKDVFADRLDLGSLILICNVERVVL